MLLWCFLWVWCQLILMQMRFVSTVPTQSWCNKLNEGQLRGFLVPWNATTKNGCSGWSCCLFRFTWAMLSTSWHRLEVLCISYYAAQDNQKIILCCRVQMTARWKRTSFYRAHRSANQLGSLFDIHSEQKTLRPYFIGTSLNFTTTNRYHARGVSFVDAHLECAVIRKLNLTQTER